MIGTEVVANDVLLNITGGSLGRCAVVPSSFNRGNVSQHVCILRCILTLPNYLHSFILSDHFNKTMILSGSGREGLPKYSIEKMMIPIPPFEEQKRIIAEIDRISGLIEELEKDKTETISFVSQAKTKILSLAIQGKLVVQDPNDEPASELLKRINPDWQSCDTSHYPFIIPYSWEWVSISDIGTVITGTTPNKDIQEYYGGNYPFFKPADLAQGENVINSIDSLTKSGLSQSRKLRVNSILVTCVGATIGKTGLIKREGATNQQINAIEPFDDISYLYLYYLCNSEYFQNEIIKNSSATTLPIINKTKFSSILCPLPPKDEQIRIVNKIKELFDILDSIFSQLN